jgi:hypothetical protein
MVYDMDITDKIADSDSEYDSEYDSEVLELLNENAERIVQTFIRYIHTITKTEADFHIDLTSFGFKNWYKYNKHNYNVLI